MLIDYIVLEGSIPIAIGTVHSAASFDRNGNLINNDKSSQSKRDNGSNSDIVDNLASAIGVNMDVKEGLLEFAKKSSDIGKAGNNYLKVTKFLGKATGWTSAYTSWVDYRNNPTTANRIKLGANIGLAVARINPFISLGVGILDLSGGTDWMYNQAGDYWDKNWGGQER